jgi:hypothetical protein
MKDTPSITITELKDRIGWKITKAPEDSDDTKKLMKNKVCNKFVDVILKSTQSSIPFYMMGSTPDVPPTEIKYDDESRSWTIIATTTRAAVHLMKLVNAIEDIRILVNATMQCIEESADGLDIQATVDKLWKIGCRLG